MSQIDKLAKTIKYRNNKVFLKTVFCDTCRMEIILSSDTYLCIDVSCITYIAVLSRIGTIS